MIIFAFDNLSQTLWLYDGVYMQQEWGIRYQLLVHHEIAITLWQLALAFLG